jgi:hypothetical protein
MNYATARDCTVRGSAVVVPIVHKPLNHKPDELRKENLAEEL